MRGDTRARMTLTVALAIGLIPVRSWQRGDIDTATLAIRMAVAMAVTWAVVAVVGRVLAGYRADGPVDEPRHPGRRADDRAGDPGAFAADREG